MCTCPEDPGCDIQIGINMCPEDPGCLFEDYVQIGIKAIYMHVPRVSGGSWVRIIICMHLHISGMCQDVLYSGVCPIGTCMCQCPEVC